MLSTGWLVAVVTGVVGGLVGSGALVWQASEAAFTAQTASPASNWTAGTVALSDDDNSTAMFTASGLVPNATGQRCIVVTYDGTVASTVKLYGSSVGGSFAQYLNLVVEEGSGGSFGDCTGFVGSGTDFTGTLQSFGASKTGFTSGVGTFAPTGANQTKTYRFTYTVDAATPDAAQGTTATAVFTWEAHAN